MGLFWKRKSGDQFVSLKLNEPLPEKASEKMPEETVQTAADRKSDASAVATVSLSREEQAALSNIPTSSASPSVIEAVPTGGGPTPMPSESLEPKRPGGGLRHSAPQ